MQNQKAIKHLKLAATFLVAAVAVAVQIKSSAFEVQDKPTRLFEIVGMDVPLEKRFGVDDGTAFVVHFAGDTHGNLDTCG
jgi:hypothetical protein